MKIKLLLLALLLLTACATNRNVPITRTYCEYQEYPKLQAIGLPGAVDITTVTRTVDGGVAYYTSERKKVFNIYCQGCVDSLNVKVYEQERNIEKN